MFHISRLLKSFQHAFKGLILIFQEEQNFRIHSVCAVIVFIVSGILRVDMFDFVIIFIAVSILLILEIINTVFEKLLDMLKPRVHHYVGFIKDVMAAAVLIGAFVAFITTVIILYPYFIKNTY